MSVPRAEPSGVSASLMRGGLGVWAVGVQVNEGLASLGAIATLLGGLLDASKNLQTPEVPRGPGDVTSHRLTGKLPWSPLIYLLSWGLLWSSVFRWQLPTGFGAARLLDLLGIPAAAWAASRLGPRRLVAPAFAGAVTLVVSCVGAALQHYGAWPAREAFNGLEWTRVPFDRVYEPAPGTEGRYLAGGLLFHRLRFAHVTSLGALLALAVALRAQGRARVVGAVVAAVGLSSVALFPGARAAFVAAAGACAVLVLLSAGSRKAAALSVAGIVFCGAALVLLSPALRTRLLASSSLEGSGDRAGLIRAGVAAVSAHPFVGVGPGHFRATGWAPEDASHFAKEHGGKTHNLFLTAAAEMGIPGALLLAYFLFWLALGYWRAGGQVRVGLAVLALLLALGMLHDPLFHAEVSLAFALALGLCRGAQELQPR